MTPAMRSSFSVLSTLLILLCGTDAAAQIPDCPCGATKGHHQREAVKNRPIPPVVRARRILECDEIIGSWDIPPKNTRHTYPREDTLFTVRGYLRLIKIEKNDCDIHLEISGTKSRDADRIIAEIPNTNEYCSLRNHLFVALREKFHVKKVGKSKREFRSRMPVITLTGYAFCDTPHRRRNNPVNKRGTSHGGKLVATMWEIHPVVDVTIQ